MVKGLMTSEQTTRISGLIPSRVHELVARKAEQFHILRKLRAEAHVSQVVQVDLRIGTSATLANGTTFANHLTPESLPPIGLNVFPIAVTPRDALVAQESSQRPLTFCSRLGFPVPLSMKRYQEFLRRHLIESIIHLDILSA